MPLLAPSLSAAFCNALDHLIDTFLDPPHLRPSADPRHVLSGNFAPVSELHPTPCRLLHGTLPPCLTGGAYIRNGPNPQHLHKKRTHHLFDGDGMLHSLLLLPTHATLSSRHVHTYKYLLEKTAGAPVFPNVFSGFHGLAGLARALVAALRILTCQVDPLQGVGLANTSLAFFNGTLYALGESDLPYAVHVSSSDGDVSTLGRCDFEGRLAVGMTAHPKRDPITGELFAFRWSPLRPHLTYFRFDQTGRKAGADVPISSVREPTILHDFAITKRYVVFPDIQVVMKPLEMIFGGKSLLGADKEKVPRLGVLPRYAVSESEIRWFEVPGFNTFHCINAWEEKDTIVLVAPNVVPIENALERTDLVETCVEMVRIDLKSGAVTRTPLASGRLDFGVIHPGYMGRQNRYAYLGAGDPLPKLGGVVKLDLARAGEGECVVARRNFGPGRFGGEPFFVAERDDGEGEEDEGYLVCYVHDEVKGESRFVVMNAQSPELEVVAEVLLPHRVPYGFHGLFVSEAELRSQQPPDCGPVKAVTGP